MEGILRAVDAVFPEQSPTTQPADASVQSGERSDTCSALARHTPLPWKFTRTHGCSSDTWYVVTDANGYGPIVDVGGKDVSGQIAEAKHLITDPEVVTANAAYIVTCANAYPILVERLKQLNGILEDAPELNLSNYDHDQVAVLNSAMVEACLLSRAALAEAGEL